MEALTYYGRGRYCPVCDRSSRRFRPFGIVERDDAECAHCGALERHRFMWRFLQNNTNLFHGTGTTMLHVAPERCFEPFFKERLGGGYLTADLFDPRAMVKMDICDIRYPDGSFDCIYCSHVLEHVLDDRKAMREFHRVLRDDGWAILNVPITREKTYEDPSIVDPRGRLEAFGKEDHVRRYGRDYADRLRDAGFTVKVITVGDVADADEAVAMGLTDACGEIYLCTK